MANVVSTRLFAGTGQYVEVTATSGNFRLSYAGQTTTTIAYNASAATVQSALTALSTIGANNVSVVLDSALTSPYPRRWRVEFVGSLNTGNVSLLGISNSSLSSGFTINTSYCDGFIVTTTDPTKNYAVDLDPGTLVVIGYQNSTNSSTAVLENSTDSAGNEYTVIRTAGSASQGSCALLWSRLVYPVTTSDTITLNTSGTQASVVVGRALVNSNLAFQNSALDSTLNTATGSYIGPTVTIAAGNSGNARMPSGVIVSVIGFENDFTFGSIPRTSPAGSTFLGAFDGRTTTSCTVALAYRQVTSASYTGASISNVSTGADFISVSSHWYELPKLEPAARVISM